MKNERPLVSALTEFVAKSPTSLHVPGHKNGVFSRLPIELKNALKYDATELEGLDDLHHPEEAIFEAQRLLSEAYDSDASFFLVNGSTVGNLAMIYATCEKGDTVIVQRNAHKSIFHAIELVGASPVYIAPEWDEITLTTAHITTQTLQKALEQYPNAKAVVLTTPTYYGLVNNDLEEQVRLCHALQIPVLVDEAHGAHFVASEEFPKSAIEAGADIVVQSAHKTLPAMTMGSYLHVRSTLVCEKTVAHYLRMLQSSSPSYLIMASLDDARQYVSNYLSSDYQYFTERRQSFINSLLILDGIEVIEVEDPLKLLVRAKGYSGFALKEQLEKQKLFVELADTEQVLMVLPLLKHGFQYPFTSIRTKVKDAMQQLKQQPKSVKESLATLEIEKVTVPAATMKEVKNAEKEWIPFTRAIGRISAELIIPYPPGIPLFVVGEKITVAKLAYLTDLLSYNADFQGNHQLDQKLIHVLK